MTTTEQQRTNTPQENASTIGVLPLEIVQIAANFASQNYAKLLLTAINVTKTKDNKIEIASTDGHRLFKTSFKECNNFYLERATFKIDAQAFKKRIAKGKFIILYSNGFCEILDKRNIYIEGRRWENPMIEGTFPDYNSLIPNSFHNKPEKKIGMNSRYLAEFCNQITRYTNGILTLETNTPSTLLGFKASIELDGIEEKCELLYLLMPVVIRDYE